MKILRMLGLILIIVLTLNGCSGTQEDSSEIAQFADTAMRVSLENDNPYLAYEHSVVLELAEEGIHSVYEELIDSCSKIECTVLNSSINNGRYTSANIRLRIQPNKLIGLIESLEKQGEMISQSTRVEDLAKIIVDSQKRLSMLTNYQAKLLTLEEKPNASIDELIKISSELSEVQSQLERESGSNKYLLQRTSMDLLNISLVQRQKDSFWFPIGEAFSSFGGNLSDGISGAIEAVAYLLPWFFLLLLMVYFIRFLWKRRG